jgi:hypothetical protein
MLALRLRQQVVLSPQFVRSERYLRSSEISSASSIASATIRRKIVRSPSWRSSFNFIYIPPFGGPERQLRAGRSL